jgi:CheY-like chemotaxis protein
MQPPLNRSYSFLKSMTKSIRSVLVVEDEAMIAMMLEDFLETLGLRLHAIAATVEDGCALAQAGGFQLAILDCHLGDQQVWPVADILAHNAIPFLLSSGGSPAGVPSRFAQRPMLEKPYTMGAVEQALAMIRAEQ